VDTITSEETSLSSRSVVSGVVAVACSAALIAPGLVIPAYGRVSVTVLLVTCTAVASRLLVTTVVAALRRDPPDPSSERWPSVSLVVTAYNEADVLAATIDACTDVDYPDDRLEVIVGYESASTDGTASVAEAAAERHPQVTAVERTASPGGKASATNHALRAASGEIVGVLDADQRLESVAVARAVRWFAGDESIWCVKGRCLGTNPGASLFALLSTVERNLVERTEFVARDRLGGFSIFTGGQAFFRAEALEQVGEFDESILLEDLDMAYRLQRSGGAVRVDPGIVTRERNPTGFRAWWNQRKRWARGGMQVARRYLGANLLSGPPGVTARVDLATTLGALLVIPLLVLATPLLVLVGWNGYLSPHVAGWLWTFVLLAPLLAAYATLAIDARDGYRRDAREYLAPLLLWPYLVLQAQAIVVSFLDEFLLRRPTRYVTSSNEGGDESLPSND